MSRRFLPGVLPAAVAFLVAAFMVAPVAGQDRTSDPERVPLELGDIHRLAEVLRSIESAPDVDAAAVIERDYLGAASPGLRAYAEQFDVTGVSIATAVAASPDRYADLEGLVEAILAREEELRSGFRLLRELFPGTVFPPVWFVVGGHGPRGQASPAGALIGAEGLDTQPDQIAPLVLHELAHFQSAMLQGVDVYRRIYGPGRTLLALALREGSAEFIARLATGRHTNPAAEHYGLQHEAALWREFRQVMAGADTGEWMWVRPADPTRPSDLGYWIGYRIVESYYDRAEDRRQAIVDILSLTDFDAFLQESNYAARFEDATVPGIEDSRWAMAAIDGNHLPITNDFEHATWGSCRVVVRSGSLVLSADYHFRLETLRKIDCTRDGESTVEQEQPEWLEGTYVVEAERLHMTATDPSFGEIVIPGVLSGSELRIQFGDNEILLQRAD
jgi:hypothetical protein